MISTHNTLLATQLSDNLKDRGFEIASTANTKPLTAKDLSDSFLNKLFSFPYLDFAFVRYEHEMLAINLGDELLVFGFCDFGIFAVTPSKSIMLIEKKYG